MAGSSEMGLCCLSPSCFGWCPSGHLIPCLQGSIRAATHCRVGYHLLHPPGETGNDWRCNERSVHDNKTCFVFQEGKSVQKVVSWDQKQLDNLLFCNCSNCLPAAKQSILSDPVFFHLERLESLHWKQRSYPQFVYIIIHGYICFLTWEHIPHCLINILHIWK